jgi:hypothetical protein
MPRAMSSFDRDAILDLWAQGLSHTEVRERLGGINKTTVETAVFKARQKGDPRAAKRTREITPNPLTAEYASKIFSLDQATGVLTWKRSFDSIRAGELAGWLQDGYIRIEVGGRVYFAHNIVWLMTTGEWPEGKLDHRDRQRSNNRFSNLRPATDSQNAANRIKHSNNTTGFNGVKFVKRNAAKGLRPYETWIVQNYKCHYLGRFWTAEEAAEAYRAGAERLFGEFARAA